MAGVPIEKGRSALTPDILKTFDGLLQYLIDSAPISSPRPRRRPTRALPEARVPVRGLARFEKALYCKEYPYEVLMITSKLTSKAQTTIPQPVRAALGLEVGDEVAYEIQNGCVILTKARVGAVEEDPFALFDEWDSEADRKAYAGL